MRAERHRAGAGWLLMGLVALVYLVVPVWTLAGGRKADAITPVPANPKATLASGQKLTFAPGRLGPGDGLECDSNGLVVGALVPSRGHIRNARQVNADATATASIKIVARRNGAVVASCS